MNTFWSVKWTLFLLIALLKVPMLSIKWSAVKNINGCWFGISLINAAARIAGAVFLLEGSKIILYLIVLVFYKYFLINVIYLELVLIIG